VQQCKKRLSRLDQPSPRLSHQTYFIARHNISRNGALLMPRNENRGGKGKNSGRSSDCNTIGRKKKSDTLAKVLPGAHTKGEKARFGSRGGKEKRAQPTSAGERTWGGGTSGGASKQDRGGGERSLAKRPRAGRWGWGGGGLRAPSRAEVRRRARGTSTCHGPKVRWDRTVVTAKEAYGGG